MKKIFSTSLISLIIVFSVNHSYGQYIYAGMVSNNDIYYDITPDVILSGQLGPWIVYSDTCSLDINQDGSFDLEIVSYSFGANGGGVSYCRISALSANVKILYNVETFKPETGPNSIVVFNVADTIQYGDTIPKNYNGASSAYLWSKYYGPVYEQPRTNTWTNIGERYIGFYIIESAYILSGWIRVSVEYDEYDGLYTIDIYDYAYHISLNTSLQEEKEKTHCKAYPNPAKDRIYIELFDNVKNGKYSIFTQSGEIKMSKKIKESEEMINIKNLEKGIYFLRIETENNLVVKKIVKN